MRSISDNADITKNRLLPFVDVFQLSPCDPMNTINKFEVFTSLMELRLIVVDGIWGSSDTTAGKACSIYDTKKNGLLPDLYV